MARTLTFLGTGDPEGIPVPFCTCSLCTSGCVQRLRASVLVEWDGYKVIIDASPDFRQQVLRAGVTQLDGLFLTHSHYDHIGGIDDLRAWYVTHMQPMPVVLSQPTYEALRTTKGYLMTAIEKSLTLPAALDFCILDNEFGESEFVGIPYSYVSYYQKDCPVTGYRFGKVAYLTDMSRYETSLLTALRGVETIILSVSPTETPPPFANRPRSHLSLEQVSVLRNSLRADVIITHISHHMQKELQSETWTCAYDGMKLPL